MMGIISTVIIGFIVGVIARFLKPGNDSMGFIMTTVLGIAGAALANFIGAGLGWYAPGQAAGWIASIVGAIILLVLYGMITKK